MTTARFTGRRVFLTGAASGVGRATALQFASEGASVFAVDMNEDGVRETERLAVAAGGQVTAATCNVTEPTSVQTAVAACVEKIGGLDILINAAGLGGSKRFEEIDFAEWRRVLSVNLDGPFLTTQAAIPHLLGQPGGVIVNVASIAGLRGQAYNSHYSASKAGLVNFTRSLALEFASRGLRATCLCPSGILTPFIRNFVPREDFEPSLVAYYSPPVAHKLAAPEEVAKLIAFLASDDAKHISGMPLVADDATLA